MTDDSAMTWRKIEEYAPPKNWMTARHVICGHADKRWIRFGRFYTELNRWYYSGTNEISQYSETAGDAPTHFMDMPLPPPPASEGE